jgi:hypothetical protein
MIPDISCKYTYRKDNYHSFKLPPKPGHIGLTQCIPVFCRTFYAKFCENKTGYLWGQICNVKSPLPYPPHKGEGIKGVFLWGGRLGASGGWNYWAWTSPYFDHFVDVNKMI